MNDKMQDERAGLLQMSSEIVCAYVSYNVVAPDGIADLIGGVHAAFGALRRGAELPENRNPAVSIRRSVQNHSIACLDCGKSFKMLKRHLRSDHNVTPTEYRARWGLGADYPIVAPDYSADRSAMAIRIGLGRKRKAA